MRRSEQLELQFHCFELPLSTRRAAESPRRAMPPFSFLLRVDYLPFFALTLSHLTKARQTCSKRLKSTTVVGMKRMPRTCEKGVERQLVQ